MEEFISKKPHNKKLSDYIAYYYFHDCNDLNFRRTYVYYPHIRNTLTVYQNHIAEISDDLCIYNPTNIPQSTVYYSRNLKKQIKVIQNGPLHKIGIVFKPLGINHFIETELYTISKETYSPFTYFKGELAELCVNIYKEEDSYKVKALDDFFIGKLISFENRRVSDSLKLIHKYKAKIKASEIASELEVSRKTIYREFRKHLCSSIEEYKAIYRFRLALNYYHSGKAPIFTDVVYENNFYDQPSFSNYFKKITGYTPRTFFNNLSKLSDNDIYWTLL